MGDEDDGAAERVEGDLELLDRREVEVVGRLVEHEQVRLPRHQHGQRRPGAFAGRQRDGRAQDVVGDEAELGEQRAGVARLQPVTSWKARNSVTSPVATSWSRA